MYIWAGCCTDGSFIHFHISGHSLKIRLDRFEPVYFQETTKVIFLVLGAVLLIGLTIYELKNNDSIML